MQNPPGSFLTHWYNSTILKWLRHRPIMDCGYYGADNFNIATLVPEITMLKHTLRCGTAFTVMLPLLSLPTFVLAQTAQPMVQPIALGALSIF